MLRAMLAVILIAGLQGGAAAQELAIKREGPVILEAAQEWVLHSEALGRDVMVRVSPPASPIPDGEKAAAIYLLDGNASFGMGSDTLRLMSLEGATWPAYLISIGYDTTDTKEVMSSRAADYLHNAVSDPETGESEGGGGAAFETFVVDKLKPFIEARLAVDPEHSIIGGHSYGGLFVSNLIARRADAFSAYLIGSPSVWADPKLVDAVAATDGAGKAIYLSVGEKEVFGPINMVTDAADLTAALEQAGFDVTSRVHANQTHTMETSIWMAEGFRHLLAKEPE